MKLINRNSDPYLMIILSPVWILYWIGTAMMALTIFCNQKWTKWEELNK